MIWIVISICITLTIWFVLAAKIFYDLKVNKEYEAKAKCLKAVVSEFRSSYLDGSGKDIKYVGKGNDVKNLLGQINSILNLGIWNL